MRYSVARFGKRAKIEPQKSRLLGGGGGRARKDSNLWPLESELTDYFGLIVRNLE